MFLLLTANIFSFVTFIIWTNDVIWPCWDLTTWAVVSTPKVP